MAENNSKKKLVWSSQDESRYNSLYNKLKERNPDITKENYIKNFNKRNLQEFIHKLELSTSTKESYYFMVSKWLKINNPQNESAITTFSNLGHKLMMERSKDYAENTLSEKSKRILEIILIL